MDQQQTQRIQGAAEQLTDSTQQVFRTMADRAVSLQESNLKLTQNFFQNWIEQVNNRAQVTREATQTLREQSQRQRVAIDTLSNEGTNVYSDFLNSALGFYQEALNTATQVAQQNMQQGAEATQQAMEATSQSAKQAIEATSQSAQQSTQAAKQAAQENAETTKQAAQQNGETANQAAQQNGETTKQRSSKATSNS